MIVDLHTHIWESPEQLGTAAAKQIRNRDKDPWEIPPAGTDSHLEAAESVDVSVVLGFESSHLEAQIPYSQIHKYVEQYPDQLIGFAGLDPMQEDCLEKMQAALSLGAKGIVISPSAQDFHPAHTDAMRIYEVCQDKKLPVLLHCDNHFGGNSMLRFSQAYMLDEVAQNFPDLRLVISQVGYPWVAQALVVIGKHDHIYADISDLVRRPWELYNVLLGAYQQGVIKKLLFGSDFPFCTPEKAISTIYSINTLVQGTHLPNVPREQLRAMVERNTLSILRIDGPLTEDQTQIDLLKDDFDSQDIVMQVIVPAPDADQAITESTPEEQSTASDIPSDQGSESDADTDKADETQT